MDPAVKPVALLRTNITKIESWQDADTALGVLRFIESKLDRINAEHDAEVQRIQEARKRRTTPLVDRRTRIEELLEVFVTTHRAEMGAKKKSIKVVHGKMGFRWASPKVVYLDTEPTVIERLKANHKEDCILTKEDLDKAAIKKLPDELLTACGIQIIQEERFFLELSKEETVKYPDVDPDDPEAA